MSSEPTNYNIHLFYQYPETVVKNSSDSTSNTIPNLKLNESNICLQIWSCIFNNNQEPTDLKSCDGNKNNRGKAKENWDDAISVA